MFVAVLGGGSLCHGAVVLEEVARFEELSLNSHLQIATTRENDLQDLSSFVIKHKSELSKDHEFLLSDVSFGKTALFHFAVEASANTRGKYYLIMSNVASKADLLIEYKDGQTKTVSASKYLSEEVYAPYTLIPFEIRSGKNQIFVREYANMMMASPILIAEKDFANYNLKRMGGFLVLCSATIVLIVYNLFTYIVYRKKLYLYLSVSAIFGVLLSAGMSGWLQKLVIDILNIKAGNDLLLLEISGRLAATTNLTAVVSAVFLLQFTQLFLEVDKKNFPFIYFTIKLMQFVGTLFAILFVVASCLTYEWLAVSLPYQVAMSRLYGLVGLFVLIGLGVLYCFKTKKTESIIFLFATASNLFLVFVYIMAISKIVKSPFLAEFGFMLGFVFQLSCLALAVGYKLDRKEKRRAGLIAKLNEELNEVNSHLEELVEEKTRDSKAVLANVSQGIFAVRMEEGPVILPDYSCALESIVGSQNLRGTDPIKSVFSHSDLSSELINMIFNTFMLSLGEDELQWQIVKDHLPGQFKIANREIEATYDVVFKDEVVEKIIVSMRDVTSINLAKEEARLQQNLASKIVKITSIEEMDFVSYINHTRTQLQQVLASLSLSFEKSLPINKQSMRDLHSLKGLARFYGFTDISAKIHDIESLVSQYGSKGDIDFQIVKEINEVFSELTEYGNIAKEKLKI